MKGKAKPTSEFQVWVVKTESKFKIEVAHEIAFAKMGFEVYDNRQATPTDIMETTLRLATLQKEHERAAEKLLRDGE